MSPTKEKPTVHTLAHEAITKMPFYGNAKFQKWSSLGDAVEEYMRQQLLQSAYAGKINFSKELGEAKSVMEGLIEHGTFLEAQERVQSIGTSGQDINRLHVELTRTSMKAVDNAIGGLKR